MGLKHNNKSFSGGKLVSARPFLHVIVQRFIAIEFDPRACIPFIETRSLLEFEKNQLNFIFGGLNTVESKTVGQSSTCSAGMA